MKPVIYFLCILLLIIGLFILNLHIKYDLSRYRIINNITKRDILDIVPKYLQLKRVPIPQHTVISLTTIPSRIDELYYVIYSLLDQTTRVDEILLNIPYENKKGKYHIPLWMTKLVKCAPFIILNRCIDVGPITKMVPSLERYNDKTTTFIIVDDDTIYKRTMVEKLCLLSLLHPRAAITNTGYRTFRKDGSIKKYDSFPNVRHVDVLMGYCGYLIHRWMFKEDWSSFYSKRLFFFVDDNCISLYLDKHSIPIYSLINQNGLSLMAWDHLVNWFSPISDSLSGTGNNNSPNAFSITGKTENYVLNKFGYYVTNTSFLSYLIS